MPAALKIHKETAVPGTLEANAVYLITDTNGAFLEMYVVNSAGSAARRLPSRTDIEGWINSAVSGLGSGVIVADIAARNALSPSGVVIAYVLNATGDATVSSGGATYIYNPSGSSWTKIAEFESMDTSMSWASLTGKPTSSPAQIDAAVAATHSHSNKTQLDKIGEASGEMQYNGDFPLARLSTANW